MINRRVVISIAVVLVVAAVAYVAYDWYRGHDVRLTEAPARTGGAAEIVGRDSVLNLRADIPLALLREAAQAAIPTAYPFSGHGEDACAKVFGAKVCAGTRYSGTVYRAGDVSIQGSGRTLTVSAPIKVEGKGGFRGDGAKLLDLDEKNFRAALNLKATITLDFNPDWSPAFAVKADYRWPQNPRVEIVGGVWVDVTRHVDDKVRETLKEAESKLRDAVPADIVRREVAKAWRTYTLPLPGAENAGGYAHVIPTAIGFSGISFDNDRARIGLMLKARTEISTSDRPSANVPPLPKLTKMAAAPGRLSLAIPIRAGYDDIRAALVREAVGKTFVADLEGAKASVTVRDVFLYPSGDGLAAGIRFAADVPGRIFDVTGEAFLVAKPAVEGTVLRLADVRFSRRLDNALWSAASAVFEDQIKAFVAEKAELDLAPARSRLVDALKQKLESEGRKSGIDVKVRNIDAAVEALVPEAEDLAALVRLDVGIDTELVSLPLGGPASK